MHIGILGGGLAGSFLAARLLEANCKVTLIDEPVPHSASNIAAGLFNVITGRFGAKTWNAETFSESLYTFFQHPQHSFLAKYLHQVPIYRPFKSIDEYNKWTGRNEDPAYAVWTSFQEKPFMPEAIQNTLGGIWINRCGWLDTKSFLASLKRWLVENRGLQVREERIEYQAWDLKQKTLHLGGNSYTFDAFVYCEGYQAIQNPFFHSVKLIPNKGELLEIEVPELSISWVLSRKIYMIPLGNKRYLVGSTYKNAFESIYPTEAGKEEIIEKLNKALAVPFEVKAHTAGVRPTTPNRRPILGVSPQHNWIYMLNGLGTKGVLQAPYFSLLMRDLILGKHPSIPKEVDAVRFN
ncbi:MAG: FAD-dependent oxidoreductase [Bacteroidota bacterium]